MLLYCFMCYIFEITYFIVLFLLLNVMNSCNFIEMKSDHDHTNVVLSKAVINEMSLFTKWEDNI